MVEERLLALVDTADVTGIPILHDTLDEHQLSVQDVCRTSEAAYVVRRKVSRPESTPVNHIQCCLLTTSQLESSRASVNAVCDTSIPDVLKVFGIVDLMFTVVDCN